MRQDLLGKKNENFKLKLLKEGGSGYKTVMDMFYKQLGGENIVVEELYAVYPEHLLNAFIIYKQNMEKRLATNANLFQHQKWQEKDSDGLKQWVKDRFDKFVDSFPWNLGNDVKIIPQLHGTDFNTATAICNTGFATLSSLDEGWYGKGIYFTSSAVYTTPYFATKKKPAIVIAYVIPGNPYPVCEHPKEDNSLIGAALQSGCQSHYVITSIDGYPVKKPCSVCFTELVINQEAQVLPAFILSVGNSNLTELVRRFQRDIVEH